MDQAQVDGSAAVRSWGGSLNASYDGIVQTGLNVLNKVAMTVTASRFDLAMTGSSAHANALTTSDRPPGAFVTAFIDAPGLALQSITIYDPLPTTAGLSALSALS